MEKSKICTKCNIDKPIIDFCKDSKIKSGYASKCKQCAKDYINSRKNLPKKEIKHKICTKCGLDKVSEEYCNNINTVDGLKNICKQCEKQYRLGRVEQSAEYYQNNKESLNLRGKENYKNNLERYKEQNKKYQTEHKEVIAAYKKQYAADNSDKIREYRTENKSKLNENRKKYRRNKKDSDPLFKLKGDIRGLILQAFKKSCKGKYKKNSKTLNILGCSHEEFKAHIESQFLNWMNWNNHGNCETNEYNCTWNIDHIMPISLARNEDEIYMLNHWSNFQPLCSKVNRDKWHISYPLTNLELGINSLEYFQ